MEGEYFWERIYYIDNTNQNNPFKETRKVTKTIKASYSELTKFALEAPIKISRSFEALGIIKVVNIGVKGSLDLELSSSYESTVEKHTETTVSEELTREFTVGANSIDEMFRLVYKGPGVTYATGTVSTNGTIPLDKVIINCRVQEIPLIKDIDVVYTGQSVDVLQFIERSRDKYAGCSSKQ